jgi:peptidyl-prolyl cis-trans isomerase SurA
MMHRDFRSSALLVVSSGLFLSFAAVVPSTAQSRGSNFVDNPRTATSTSPYQGTIVEEIVAMVNDQVISKSDYERAEHELDQEAQQQGWSQSEVMQQRRDLLRSLIDKQLLLSKGKELDINGESELVKRLDEMRKQYHLDTMEDLQKAAEAQGVSWEDLKQQIRDGVIQSDVISQEVGRKIDVAPSEIRDYYNAHVQDFKRPEQVKLSEILVPTPNPDDAAQVSSAETKANDIEARLKSGADFATVAKADSGGPTAAEGGRLGEYKRGDLPKVMEDATFGLQQGQYTSPIRTKQGWLILEVTDHTQGGTMPLDQVQGDIQEKLGMQKMEPAMRSYLAKLRDEAAIQVRAPYSDSGATPNEIKFIEGAYQPPQPKKKKHAERARFREKPERAPKQTATNSATPPAGVPTLDQVNSQKGAPVQVASSSTEKPGKKEKIRYGQAPRETLPSGTTKQVDAGATAPAATDSTDQVAANGPAPNTVMTNASGDVINNGAGTDKEKKTRLSDRMKETKQKQAEEKAASKKQKFAPPTETTQQQAEDKQQQSAVGLNGDTTKQKKPNPAKAGPKRRMGEEDKSDQQDSGTSGGTAAPAQGAQPSQPQAPQPSQSAPSPSQPQGTQPNQPQL